MANVTARVYANASAEINSDEPSTNLGTSTVTSGTKGISYLLMSFAALPDAVLYCKIVSACIGVYMQAWNHSSSSLSRATDALEDVFDEKTVTYNSRPGNFGGSFGYKKAYSADVPGYFLSPEVNNLTTIRNVVNYGVQVDVGYIQMQTSRGTYKPYLEIVYDDSSVSAFKFTRLRPSEGTYIDKNAANVFDWSVSPTISTIGTLSQTNAVLEWRNGTSGTINQVQCGANASVTLPAGTLVGNDIQWRVTVTASSGVQTVSDWISLDTTEPTGTSNVVSPKNAVLDGTADNTFTWEHIISTGTAQTAFDLQTSPDGVTWTTLRSMTTSETSVVIPANTLTGGDLYWRVRTYNTDGVAGEWSEAAHCIVVAAPAAPLVSIVDTAPRFSIRWQQSGQQGYEIMLDGQLIAKKWGETSFYQYDGYLTPGSYEVKVRIQNQYGLWSEWGSASLPIANTEGAAITLYAEADNVVRLQWSTTGAYDAYLIYRDGQLIGQTQEMTFTDNFAMGAVVYEVRGIYEAAGNYTLSNAVAVEASVDVLMISPVKDPAWQQIPLSTSSLRSRSHSATQSVTYLHYTGIDLPSAEIGEALDKTYRFDAAFPQTEKAAADAFEDLIGKLVCVKDPDGYRIVGVLGTHSLTSNPFYRSYSCTVTLVGWKEGAGL